MAIVFVGFIATATVAADTAPGGDLPAVNWTVFVVAIIGATSAGTRLLRWCRDNAKILRIIADVLEAASKDPTTKAVTRIVKAEVDKKMTEAGAAVADVAEKIAANAEKRNGTNGGATDARRESKGARFMRGVKKWLPIVGLLG